MKFIIRLILTPLSWLVYSFQHGLNFVNSNRVTYGLVDIQFPQLRHDVGVIARTLFVDYFDPRYTVVNIVVSGDAYMFTSSKPQVLASGIGWTEGPVWSDE